MLGCATIGVCRAQLSAQALEYRVKAAFICKFASYVEWPAALFDKADSPITIGVMGTDAIVDELTRTAAGLLADGRSLVVRRWQRGTSPAGIHILFIARYDDGRLPELLSEVIGRPTLVVTESNQLATGSAINFRVIEDKIRFDIAPQVAEASGLRVSARLLGVARNIVKSP